MDPRIQELEKQVHDLRELLDKKIPSANEVDRMDELTKKVVELEEKINHPEKTERKMVWAVPDEKGKLSAVNDGEERIYFADFMRAILPGNQNSPVVEKMRPYLKTVMSEGTPAQGGYLVPEEFSNKIIELAVQESILQRLGFEIPMGALTRRVPRQLTQPSLTWTDEGVAKTVTKPTVDRLTQTAKKLAGIVQVTDELLEDNSIGLDKWLLKIVAKAFGLEFDRVGFVGNTGAGDPFMGVAYAVGVNTIAQVGGTLDADDIINLIFGIGAAYRKGSTLITSSHGLRLIMQLKDANGQYLWQAPAGNQPAKIWTYPYEVSDQIPSTFGTGTQTEILFGNWGDYYFYSPRGGYEVVASNEASDPVNNLSAFMQDETWYRFKRRISLDVALPVAFSRMDIGV